MKATATHPTPRGSFLTVDDPNLHTLLIERDKYRDACDLLFAAANTALGACHHLDVQGADDALQHGMDAYEAFVGQSLPDYMAGGSSRWTENAQA